VIRPPSIRSADMIASEARVWALSEPPSKPKVELEPPSTTPARELSRDARVFDAFRNEVDDLDDALALEATRNEMELAPDVETAALHQAVADVVASWHVAHPFATDAEVNEFRDALLREAGKEASND
jgi:hypothetical protein